MNRNGDKQQEVNITQDGVQIEPAQPGKRQVV